MNKEINCPICNGYGFISHVTENSMWSEHCSNCNGIGTVKAPMTNGDIIRTCSNEELAKVIINLKTWSIYSGGENNRLLCPEEHPDEWLEWIDKESDDIDMRTIFDFVEDRNT